MATVWLCYHPAMKSQRRSNHSSQDGPALPDSQHTLLQTCISGVRYVGQEGVESAVSMKENSNAILVTACKSWASPCYRLYMGVAWNLNAQGWNGQEKPNMHHQWAALKVRSAPSQRVVFLSLCREWRKPSTLSVEKGPDSAKVLQFTLFTALYQRQLLVTTSSATGSTTPLSLVK